MTMIHPSLGLGHEEHSNECLDFIPFLLFVDVPVLLLSEGWVL